MKALALSIALGLCVVAGAARADLRPPPAENGENGENHGQAREGHEADEDPSKDFNYTNFHYPGHDMEGHVKDDRAYDASEPMSPPFILALFNFALFLFILAKYGGPVAKQFAADRHDQIKTALDDAAKLRKDAADKLAEYEARIKNLDAEVQKLVDGIKADAEADKARILANTEAQAAQMKRDAELRIAAEIETARAMLTKEVAVAATTAATTLLRQKTTADDQTKLVSTFISGIPTSKEARP